MKYWHLLLFVTVALVITFAPAASQAEIRPDTLNLSPFLGGYFYEGNQRLDDQPVFGLAVGYNFTERWGVEGVASYGQTEVKEGSEDNVDIYSVRFDALYHLQPNQELVPYVAAGVGWMSFHPGWGEDTDRALFNYGLGLKYFMTDDIALRADVRHVLVDGDMDKSDQVFNNLSCTFGLTFQLGPFGPFGRSGPSSSRSSEKPAAVRDADGDGVPDQYDRCSNTPPGALVDGFGCSPVTAPAAQ